MDGALWHFRQLRALHRCSFATMQPPPGRRTPSPGVAPLLCGLILLPVLAACGLLPTGVPTAPVTASGPAAPSPASTPSATATPSSAEPSRSFPAGVGTDASGRHTYAMPSEPPCALPSGVPARVAGADGPTLTVNRVARAWRSSEAGKSRGVSTGKAQADPGMAARPSSVLLDPGTPYAYVNYFEWYGLQTYVFPDPARAAGKLAAIRAMMQEPCSYAYATVPDGPSVVAALDEDRPDYLVVSGVMSGTPMTDIFIRYGNTVTEFSAAMMALPTREALTQVREALARA